MRRPYLVVIGPSGTWPENPGSGGSGTSAIDPYGWVRWHNRGKADVVFSHRGPIEAPGGVPDPRKYDDYIPAGDRRVRNLGKPTATELHFLNVDAVNTAILLVEVDSDPIVDVESVAMPPQIVSAMPVADTSVFALETAAALLAAATFTGPWRDALNFNWFGAVALTDVAGTLYIDEADAAVPTVTNLVAKQAAAATDANAPTPPAGAGFQARIVPQKTVMRFVRVRYINGAGAQARLNIQSSLSPLN